jgi:hypothetical protein
MLSRRTMPLSALGIATLYAIAVINYGAFHLADYPVFLGVATYIGLTALRANAFGMRPLDLVRWSAGITLMWASVEKWAYPQWSYPLLIQHPEMSIGFNPDFYMRAAGAVEFTLAFALVWTPLVRRFASIILLGMFISAVIPFGKVDLVGHSLIIVVLFAIAADNERQHVLLRYPWLIPFGYVAALSSSIVLYYGAHAVLFGIQGGSHSTLFLNQDHFTVTTSFILG